LIHASDRLKDDDVFIRYIIDKCGGDQLEFASSRLKNDEYTVLYALNTCGSDNCMKYVSEELNNNAEFILKIFEYRYDALDYISNNLRDDDKFISKVIEIEDDYWYGYENASDRLQKYGFHNTDKIGFTYNYEEIKNRIWKNTDIGKNLMEYHNHSQRLILE